MQMNDMHSKKKRRKENTYTTRMWREVYMLVVVLNEA